MGKGNGTTNSLAASITWAASKQTYFTILFLVDRNRVDEAYRAYAYFRWLDDHLDQDGSEPSERLAFVERQRNLMEGLFRGEIPTDLLREERMLAELIKSDPNGKSGLALYIRNMMAVMQFDANRRGRLISQSELDDYAGNLAMAVTEALHYFIGHDSFSPHHSQRYRAAIGAHVTHMLRDTLDDIPTGYINIPVEILQSNSLSPSDVDKPRYRDWVAKRVNLARDCFRAGREYLSQVENPRCRLAGYAYIARFEVVLKAIERNKYQLCRDYAECKRPRSALLLGWSAFSQAFSIRRPELAGRILPGG